MDRALAQTLALPAWNNEEEREQTRRLYAEAKVRAKVIADSELRI